MLYMLLFMKRSRYCLSRYKDHFESIFSMIPRCILMTGWTLLIASNTTILKYLGRHASILLCFLCALNDVFLSTGFRLSHWPSTCWSNHKGNRQQKRADRWRYVLKQGVMMKYYFKMECRRICFLQIKRYIKQSKTKSHQPDLQTMTKKEETDVQSIVSLNNNFSPRY